MKLFAVLRCAAGYLCAPKPPANANDASGNNRITDTSSPAKAAIQ
jgi:hypothetical protein